MVTIKIELINRKDKVVEIKTLSTEEVLACVFFGDICNLLTRQVKKLKKLKIDYKL